MAGFIDPSDITWSGKQVQSVSELILEEVFSKPSLSQIHTPIKGVKAKMQIGYAGRLSGLLGKKSTGCTPDTDTNSIEMSQKFWDPEFIEGRLVQCWKDLEPSFLQWSFANGVDKGDLTTGDFINFITGIVGDALHESWLRQVWFNDEGAANYNGSPAGVITNGVSTAYFTPFDGFWAQIFDIVATTPARKTGNPITNKGLTYRNAQDTYADQAFTDQDTTDNIVTKTLANMKYGADLRTRNKANLAYYVTQSVFDQYAKELRSNSAVDLSYQRIEGGYTSLKFENIDVIGLDFMDRNILSYQNSGVKLNLPHRALLTTREMLMVGIEEEANLTALKIFYDNITRNLFIDFGYNLDAKINQDFMIQAAY